MNSWHRAIAFLRRLYASAFRGLTGSVFVLVGANVFAQAIMVGFIPILTRLYGPSDFGVFTAYVALISILAVGVALRYDLAIPLASDEKEAINLATFAVFLAVTMSLAVGVGLLWGGHKIAPLLGLPEQDLWLIPVGLLLTGLQQIFVYWVSFKRNFGFLSANRVLQALLQGVLQVVLSSFAALGLMLGFALGRGLGVGALFQSIFLGRKVLRPAMWCQIACRYKHFPLFNLPAAFLDTIGLQLVPLMFTKLFSVDHTGYYGLAARVVAFPSVLVGQAVAQVFYPEASRQKDQQHVLASLVSSIATVLLRLGGPVFGWLYLCSPVAFVWIFGKEWQEAGVYASYLSLWLFLNFVSSPLSSIPLVKGQQRNALYFTAYEVALRLMGVWIGGYLQDPRLAILGYSMAGFIISLVYLIWIFRLVGASFFYWASSNANWLLAFSLLVVGLLALRSKAGEWVFFISSTVGMVGMGLLGLVSWLKWRTQGYA
ncbi:MAG: lipopolysaccharide biosynthesis protein [Thermus sp.]|uniref:lipopolysaccharide biosynthesis protein n=1 Tax=Thermus sp. TaxID=275 RepID=UPI00391BE200